MAEITEIAPDLFRISLYVPEKNLQFNHFLVRDEQPLLFHLGSQRLFPALFEALSRLIDPVRIRWLAFSHFEADECGALRQWMDAAPAAEPLCSFLAAVLNVNDLAPRPARTPAEGETIATGTYRFRLLPTPHLPHNWDAGLLYEESQGTLFCSDLFTHFGERPALTDDIVSPARDALLGMKAGPFDQSIPWTPDTARILRGLAALQPRTLAVMHGSSFRGDGRAALDALADLLQAQFGASATFPRH